MIVIVGKLECTADPIILFLVLLWIDFYVNDSRQVFAGCWETFLSLGIL